MSRIIFESLFISHFSIIEEATIPLNNTGLCSITGEILDSEWGAELGKFEACIESNGAGKSSIPEAFYFAITGDSFHSNTVFLDLIHRFLGSPAIVELSGIKNEQKFKIRRVLSTKTKRSSKVEHTLEFYIDNDKIHQLANSIAQTQEKIYEFLGTNPLLLLNSRVFGQGSISSFTQVNDRQKKILIDQLAGSGICERLNKVAKKLLSETVANLTTQNIETLNFQNQTTILQEEINNLKQKHQTFLWEIEKSLLTYEQSLAKVDERIKDITMLIAKQEHEKDGTFVMFQGGEQLDLSMTELTKSYSELHLFINEGVARRTGFEKQKEVLISKRDNLLKLIRMYLNGQGECPTCKQPLGVERFSVIEQYTMAEMKNLEQEFTSTETSLLEAKFILTELLSKKTNIEQQIKEINKKTTEIQGFKSNFDKLESLIQSSQQRLQDTVTEKGSILQQIEIERKKQSPYTDLLAGKIGQMDTIKQNLDSKQGTMVQLEEDKQYYGLLVRALDKDGIPLLISKDVLGVINQILQKYTNRILGPDFHMQYLINEKAKSEEIYLEVTNPKGGATYWRQSKGERKKIDLCQMFALGNFAEQQNKCNFNVKFFDEVFAELDDVSAEKILGIIKEDSTDSKFIITHKGVLRDEFKKWIKVRKIGTNATVLCNI
jgi:DNA repair exonuclease SbcCD ATPase subunit